MRSDDFGFNDYLKTSHVVEVLPPINEGHSWEPPKRARFELPVFSIQSGLKTSITVLAASTVLFVCSVMMARSSAQMNHWRHHSLKTATFSAGLMTASTAFVFMFWRKNDGQD